jgi:hypothetical protein
LNNLLSRGPAFLGVFWGGSGEGKSLDPSSLRRRTVGLYDVQVFGPIEIVPTEPGAPGGFQ